MKINEMTALLSGEARTAAAHADADIVSAYAGDMLSDVLALGSQPDVLLTGLLNPQVIRTAEMLDTACVVFLRGKEPEASILELAEKCGVCVLTSPLEMYDACGILHQHGVTGCKMSPLVREYEVPGDDFARAGEASGHIKSMLKELGFAPSMIRRVAITTYEAEINMVIHAGGGHVRATVTPEAVNVVFTDHGPGIPNVELAMQAGWSTAPQNIRALGFGAGMGLPNIRKYSDDFDIQTEVGKGTTLSITVYAGKESS